MTTVALSLVTGSLAFGNAAFAQSYHRDDGYHSSERNSHMPRHGWHQGGRIERSDWNRGRHIDYHAHHLRRPPHGYEWREVDGDYVLAAVATGLIASIILSN